MSNVMCDVNANLCAPARMVNGAPSILRLHNWLCHDQQAVQHPPVSMLRAPALCTFNSFNAGPPTAAQTLLTQPVIHNVIRISTGAGFRCFFFCWYKPSPSRLEQYTHTHIVVNPKAKTTRADAGAPVSRKNTTGLGWMVFTLHYLSFAYRREAPYKRNLASYSFAYEPPSCQMLRAYFDRVIPLSRCGASPYHVVVVMRSAKDRRKKRAKSPA